jgi:hypothetical protein
MFLQNMNRQWRLSYARYIYAQMVAMNIMRDLDFLGTAHIRHGGRLDADVKHDSIINI